ncbi:extracellular solute-binding protein [Qingshengfaniella alkalisoli]|uniref:Extracellular solute-binding protein n=1 Tax=Qingshengfaniella alkalisoli TaxID=2599296 RepID=A0A5B8J1S9_9RHOB|nr:extracellular solute-binding protein [Qingshengfaniella alkalisoli]QDY71723.1 extracellular solute-binding protein [Qingshengfaniella alkalisoli]
MTWSHPRGFDPMVACSREWQQQTGVGVDWDKRSLQDFESYPVEDLAREYDLIVIDHPHVGQITAEGCLTPLPDAPELAEGSVGRSYPSYHWNGRQWAYPIDAAAQVQAYRPDALSEPPRIWSDVLDLARDGRVILPLRPPHSLMCFFTLAANMGVPCRNEGHGDLIDALHGEQVFETLAEIAALVSDACAGMDPIDALESISDSQGPICAPLIYGYVNYSINGFRNNLVRFSDIPVAGSDGSVGSALGGTGIAVSGFSQHKGEATDFARWIAGAQAQSGLYVDAGGQAGHDGAWFSNRVNATVNGFYRDTRTTLDAAWLRPRHNGYMGFQSRASDLLTEALARRSEGKRVVAQINALYRASLPV